LKVRRSSRRDATQLFKVNLLLFIAPKTSHLDFNSNSNMGILNFVILILPTIVLGMNSLLGSMPLNDAMESVCMVWTVVEQPIYINTCFSSSTVATVDGYTTTIPNPTCIDTTITSSQTLNPPTSTPNNDMVVYTTLTTDIYTTVCPSPTVFTFGTRTYTVTKATTITITGE
jgi:hypothetical protein